MHRTPIKRSILWGGLAHCPIMHVTQTELRSYVDDNYPKILRNAQRNSL